MAGNIMLKQEYPTAVVDGIRSHTVVPFLEFFYKFQLHNGPRVRLTQEDLSKLAQPIVNLSDDASRKSHTFLYVD